MAEMGLEDFLGFEPNSRGGGKFLSKWKKRTPPEVRVWMHTRCGFVTLWQHGIPELRVFTDRDTNETVRKIWGGNWNCLENEAVLQHQNKRTDGVRDIPPQVCPVCKLLEHVRGLIREKKIGKATPIFRFEVAQLPGMEDAEPDSDQLQVLTAGGFTDMFKGDLSATDKQEIRKAGISLRDAWKENGRAKCNFVFRVVDNDNLDDGVQIAIETSLVGEKVQQVIRDQMKRNGKADGNPLLNPYAFQWEHHPKETEFQKKYHVLDLSPKAYPMTAEVRALIVDADVPDISRLVRPGNVRKLRAQLEQFALIELPWDELFGAAEKQQANQSDEEGADDEPAANELDEAVAAADAAMQTETPKVQAQVPAATVPARQAPTAAPQATVQTAPIPPAPAPATTRRRVAVAPPPEPMGDPCDVCQAPMKVGQLKCGQCGEEYQEVPEPAATTAAPVAPKTTAPAPSGTVLGADGVVAGSPQDKLNW